MGLFFRSNNRVSAGIGPQRSASLESFNHDGIQIARRQTRRREWPIRQFAYFLLAVLAFKVFLFFDMGASAYGGMIVDMSQGSTIEWLAARAMVLDPVSQWLVDGIRFGNWI